MWCGCCCACGLYVGDGVVDHVNHQVQLGLEAVQFGALGVILKRGEDNIQLDLVSELRTKRKEMDSAQFPA